MINSDGSWQFTQDFRCWTKHFKLDYAHRSLLREIHERRATSDHSVQFNGRTVDVPEGHVLISERKYAEMLGVPRSTLQRMLESFRRKGILRRVRFHPAEGVLYYVPKPDQHPELTALRLRVLGQSVNPNNNPDFIGLGEQKNKEWATSGHHVGQVSGTIFASILGGKSTCNASRGPHSGPYKKNAINNGKVTRRKNSPASAGPMLLGPSDANDDAAEAAKSRESGPSALKGGPLGLSSGQGPQKAASEGWTLPPKGLLDNWNRELAKSRVKGGQKPIEHPHGVSENFPSLEPIFSKMVITGEFATEAEFQGNQIHIRTTSDNI